MLLNDSPQGKPQRSSLSFVRWVQYISSEYRLLFTIVFSVNLLAVAKFLYHWIVAGTPSQKTCALAVSINLSISIIIREEHLVNLLYTICTSVPPTSALWIRRRLGKIYHLGGLHSGCAVAATFWFILLSIQTTWTFDFHQTRVEAWALLVITYLLDALLLAMIIMAYPTIRAKLHNAFEILHRLAGWSSLVLLWTLNILDTDLSKEPKQSLGNAVFTSPNIWLLFLSTFSVMATWLNLRRIPTDTERLSSHALRMRFDYLTPQPGTTIRLSTRPLFEWHAFATWAQPGKSGFSLIVSNAGDWTKKLIQNPPRHIWARRTPTCGVMRIAPMFKSVLLVATGSGIAPCLPVLMAQQTRINLYWSTREPLKTYGTEIAAIINGLGKRATIHDTTTMGRPSILPTVIDLYRRTESEAVIVISNAKLTLQLVQDLEYIGIPAFGPIWDS